jgi:carbon storage regulator
MLVLTRRETETIRADIGLEIRILEIRGNAVKIGLVAPPNIRLLRGELLDAPAADQGAAAESPGPAATVEITEPAGLATRLRAHADELEALFLQNADRFSSTEFVSRTLTLLAEAAEKLQTMAEAAAKRSIYVTNLQRQIKHEHNTLRRLLDTGPGPEPIDCPLPSAH